MRSSAISPSPGRGSTRLYGAASATAALSVSMSSGSAITTGPGPPVDRAMKRVADELRNARGLLDLHDPLGDLAEHAPVVDLLERLALDLIARDLADEEHHRRRVLKRRVHADARRCVAPGPRVTKQTPGLPVSFP